MDFAFALTAALKQLLEQRLKASGNSYGDALPAGSPQDLISSYHATHLAAITL